MPILRTARSTLLSAWAVVALTAIKALGHLTAWSLTPRDARIAIVKMVEATSNFLPDHTWPHPVSDCTTVPDGC